MQEEKSNDLDDELDGLLSELQKDPSQISPQNTFHQIEKIENILKEEDLEVFINKNAQILLHSVMSAVKEVTQDILDGADGEKIEAFAKLIDANAKVIDLLNKRLIKDKDNRIKKELAVYKMTEGSNENKLPTSDTNVIMSREELMSQIFKEIKHEVEKNDEPIDVDFDETS